MNISPDKRDANIYEKNVGDDQRMRGNEKKTLHSEASGSGASMTLIPELLAPAGHKKAAEAAIEAGADAIYFGAERFSARRRAKNFTPDEIKETLALCRAYSVKTYAALNTSIRQTELTEALKTAESLYLNGCDALILSDLGLAKLILEHFPQIELHASTQLSSGSSESALVLSKLGFSRMVCPRELSLEEVKHLCLSSPIQIEMFIHGAHCASYSGQCLMSFAMGGRSGNRGDCAQPCRLPYSVCGRSDYEAMSLKDLCLAAHIPEILSSGAASLKIEGRLKSAEYVHGTVSVYRQLIDDQRPASREELEYLSSIFSRDGFTDGYFKASYAKMTGMRRKGDSELNASAFSGLTKKVPVKAKLSLIVSKPAKLTLCAGDKTAEIEGGIVTKAEGGAVKFDSAKKSISKLGNTPFVLEDFTAAIDENAGMSLSVINELRRQAVDTLLSPPERAVITKSGVNLKSENTTKNSVCPEFPQKIAVFSFTEHITSTAAEFFDLIFIPYYELKKAEKFSFTYGITLPPIDTENSLIISKELILNAKKLNIPVLCSTLAQLYEARKNSVSAVVSHRFNIFSDESASVITNLGASLITVSPEIPLRAMAHITERHAAVVYGRLPLMLLCRCIISDGGRFCGYSQAGGRISEFAVLKNGMLDCEKFRKSSQYICRGTVKDRTNTVFPVLGMPDCTNEIYNSVPIYMGDRQEDICADAHIFIFTDEKRHDIDKVISCFKNKSAFYKPYMRLK